MHVSVAARGGWAVIAVRDDGVGFDPAAARAAAHGLAGMRFRVQSSRGRAQDQVAGRATARRSRRGCRCRTTLQDAVGLDAPDVATLLGPAQYPQPPANAARERGERRPVRAALRARCRCCPTARPRSSAYRARAWRRPIVQRPSSTNDPEGAHT